MGTVRVGVRLSMARSHPLNLEIRAENTAKIQRSRIRVANQLEEH
jgi:hypothetical protein